MTPCNARVSLILLLCLTLSAPLSFAEAPPERLTQRAWEEMVVVGSHQPRPAREVGSAVSVLNAADIQRRRVALGSELLREVPGLAVNRSGQVGNLTQVRIRGAEGNHTLVLIDGIEANDPGLSGEFNFADLLTYDVGRVEVLRGPQSALYGSEAIGGVISIRSAEPSQGLEVHGEAEGGSFGTQRLGASLAGAGERVSGRLSAVHFDTDGISASAIEPEKDGYENTTLHGVLGVQITPQLDARLVLRSADNDVETDRQDFDFPPTPTQGLIVDADNNTESSQRYGLVEFNAALLDGDWLHRAAYGYTDTESDSFSADVRSFGTRGERRKLEYQSTLKLGSDSLRHTLTGGVQRELLEFENISAFSPGANYRRQDDQTSYVAEYALTAYDIASLSMSVRHDDNDRFDDATTVRVTGSYLLESTATRLHASYGQGITNPTFTELFGFDPNSFVGNPDLTPEESDGYDFGIEQSLFAGRALVDVTYFRASLDDEIITVFDFDTFTSTAANQTGDSRRQGVEMTLQAQIDEQWSLQGSYTYLDATDPDGRGEVRRPDNSASVNVNYRFLGGRGNLNLGAIFNGEQEDSEFINATPRDRVTLDDYTLVNAAASFDVNDTLQFFVRGENLLDEDYTEVFGYRSPGAAGYLGLRARL
ncbi:MAG: TonB-dependent receptor [Gammaproteobacteria bacterium]|nr:TonB-dependent receptor [Gammaproteobacteria bacterium]